MTADPGATPDPLEVLRAALGAQYRIERLLGQGGMGSVYLARDLTLDRPVAIKVINPDVAGNATLRSRFLQEARAVARLRHPNIVPVYAAGEADGMLYFVMEYVPGESLREVLARQGRQEGDRAAEILRDLALALHHAHSQGLVHRDVKPENILIDAESGRALLMDFGVARAVEQDGGMTQAGMVLGSPRYMSPEQAAGDSAIDGRSDLYSLALVGYEMCSGTPVVQASTVAGMLVKHLTETPAPLGQAAVHVPAHLAGAIDKGLAKDPALRWQTGREFAEAVAGSALTPSGELPGVRPAGRRARTGRVAAGIAAVGLAALAGWLAFGRTPAAGSAFLVAPFEIQSGDPGVTWLREGSVNMLTLTFGQWSDLKVVDYERTLSLLDAEGLSEKARLSLDDALALARRADAGTVVTGQVQTTADSLVVIARLFDVASGESARQAQVSAPLADDPRPLFDRLAQQLLDIQGGRTSTMQLAQATTTNLAAYRAYLDGVRHLNAWRLAEADAEFARAVALDSTFALAFHKRSLGLGWSQAGGSAYLESGLRAFQLADRLPPRERALVEGHYHLSRALVALNTGDSVTGRSAFLASVRAYTDLISRGDSLVAEAWYGLADAYFHGRSGLLGLPLDSIRVFTTRSLQGFNRTLAIDSTYHLAYSHLVQLYNAAGQGSGLLIDADTVILVADSAAAARLGGPAVVNRFRDAATRRGVEIARAWARADTESSQPILQLAQSFTAAGLPDSAHAVLARALEDPARAAPVLRLNLLATEVGRGDSALAGTLAYVLDRYTRDSLATASVANRVALGGFLLTAAAMLGRPADVDRAIALVSATDSTFPFSTVPTGPTLELYRVALGIAMGGEVTPAARQLLLERFRGAGALEGPAGQQLRNSLQSVVYLAFLTTRDTAFRSILTEWGPGATLTELDALAALSAGDTATARTLARGFPAPDSLRNPAIRFGVGGMRSVARAEVLAAVGMTRQAVETLEATDLARINQSGIAEPGYAIWVRSGLARARLWAGLGETARAITAYEEFLRRWAHAEGPPAAEVRQARAELGRLRDAPPPT